MNVNRQLPDFGLDIGCLMHKILFFLSRARDSISRSVCRSVGLLFGQSVCWSVAKGSEHATYGNRPCYYIECNDKQDFIDFNNKSCKQRVKKSLK